LKYAQTLKRPLQQWINVVAFRDQAHAYLDFSIGGFLLQALLAAVAGAAVFVRNYWARLKAIIFQRRLLGERAPSEKKQPQLFDQNEQKE
jgi:hypothetical protein